MATPDPTIFGETPAEAAEPQFTGTTLSTLCHYFGRPQLMTGLFRDLLVRHFHDGANIEEGSLRHLVWRNNIATSKILIESVYRWKPQDTESRPAILIKRNAYSTHRAGIGDRDQGPIADRQGNAHYNSFWIGSHTLFCIGGAGAEAELLATEVARELHHFGPVIRSVMHLHQFRVLEIGELAKLEEAEETFVAPVNVGYAFEDRWVLSQQAPALHRISLSMLLDL